MAEPFLAEIRIIGFTFAPRGWAFCNGQILPITQNQSLYALLGTNYGGDGRASFALPDLRSRSPLHKGEGHQLGQKGGYERVTLSVAQLASHKHALTATDNPADSFGSGALSDHYLAKDAVGLNSFVEMDTASLVTMNATSISNAGGGQGHDNMQPSLVLNYCIALKGIFPSRN